LVVVDRLDAWDSTPIIFTGYTIFMITVFTGLSLFGVPFLIDGAMVYFWWINFIPTLIIDTATLLRHLHRMMN